LPVLAGELERKRGRNSPSNIIAAFQCAYCHVERRARDQLEEAARIELERLGERIPRLRA
jgi:hypothetical protein